MPGVTGSTLIIFRVVIIKDLQKPVKDASNQECVGTRWVWCWHAVSILSVIWG